MAKHSSKHGAHYGREQTPHRDEDDDIGQHHRPARSPAAALKKLSATGQKAGRAGAGSRR